MTVINNIVGNAKIRRGVYIFLGLLLLIMVGLSFMQDWVLATTTDMTAYGSVAAQNNGLPNASDSGAFLILNEDHNPLYEGNLLQLLAVTEPAVDSSQGAHLMPHEISSILIQSSELSDPTDYQVLRLDNSDPIPVDYTKQPGNKLLYIKPKAGSWPPGDYLLQIPAEGMFGGLDYYQFFVDPEK